MTKKKILFHSLLWFTLDEILRVREGNPVVFACYKYFRFRSLDDPLRVSPGREVVTRKVGAEGKPLVLVDSSREATVSPFAKPICRNISRRWCFLNDAYYWYFSCSRSAIIDRDSERKFDPTLSQFNQMQSFSSIIRCSIEKRIIMTSVFPPVDGVKRGK